MAAQTHLCYYPEDDEGWHHVECECGFDSGPLPDMETAADVAGDHRIAALLNDRDTLLRELGGTKQAGSNTFRDVWAFPKQGD